jgi:hypothetical protein
MAAADFPAFFTRGLKIPVCGIIPQSHQAHSASTSFPNQIIGRLMGNMDILFSVPKPGSEIISPFYGTEGSI